MTNPMTEEAREARDLAVRKFRLELEDNGGFDAGEIAMLTMSFDRAYGEGVTEGIRQAREAVADELPFLDISEASADTLRDIMGALEVARD